MQEKRIEYFKKKEINKGPEDAVVSEMIKQLPLVKIYIITRCFQERFLGQMEAPNSWKIVKLVFLRKPDVEPKKGIRSYRVITLTLVLSKWFASCNTSPGAREGTQKIGRNCT